MTTYAQSTVRTRSPRRPLPRRLTPARRLRRIVVLTLALCSIPVFISYLSAVTEPSNSSLTILSFEWLRDHGAAPIASQIESVYYSLNGPSTGGPTLRRLPLSTRGGAAGVHPPNIVPLVRPPLGGEGMWTASERWSGPDPPVLLTQFRSDPLYPQMVAGVAWIDTSRAWVQLYPGRREPAVSLPDRGPLEVPPARRSRLLAAFNSAFKLGDSGGGFALAGRTYSPMKPGMATLIGYAGGRVDVQAWSGGSQIPPDVQYARQNLPLIVSGGRPGANLSNDRLWGVTVGNTVRVWRSGIGVDAHGNLIYAAADGQTVRSLAQILIRAGAVRAMELDINSYWVTFITYGMPGASEPSSLLPGMNRGSERYLTPDDRDFLAVYLR